jgi:hypothetical protein
MMTASQPVQQCSPRLRHWSNNHLNSRPAKQQQNSRIRIHLGRSGNIKVREPSQRGLNLVSCPRNTRYFAGGQLAVFQGGAKRSYLSHTARASNAEKQPTGPGPEGCDENRPAAALLVGHVSVQICSLLSPCRRPILIATKYLVFRGQDTSAHSGQTRMAARRSIWRSPKIRCSIPE